MKLCSGLVVLTLLLGFIGEPALAEGPLVHSGQSVQHSGMAFGHTTVGSAKLASGVAAVPFAALAVSGQVSGEISEELWEAANAPVGVALPIAEETVTAGPAPDKALRVNIR